MDPVPTQILKDDGRVTFIGDVHGWADRLERVLAQAEGQIVFLGDLVDRGPDAAAVVGRVRDLCIDGRARAVMGNHEFGMVRSLGLPEAGIPGDSLLERHWLQAYGGQRTAASYGHPAGGAPLARAAAVDLAWMAGLPWCIEGRAGGKRYIAVHAGLDRRPWRVQLCEFSHPLPYWSPTSALPRDLYAKDRLGVVPDDLPDDVVVISGHVPLPQPLLQSRRWCIDTSGGLPDRVLTGVVFPEGRIIHS